MFESIEASAQQVVEFVRQHEPWAAPIVFALAFGESLAFISLLIPAWAALVGIGVLISHGNLNFWPIWVAGSIGAALGDWLSYWLGVKLGPPVAHIWPLSRHPDIRAFAGECHQPVRCGDTRYHRSEFEMAVRHMHGNHAMGTKFLQIDRHGFAREQMDGDRIGGERIDDDEIIGAVGRFGEGEPRVAEDDRHV